jgi:lipid II:glycine glycyltransferase (peptidoglycan interpeptide bridge formation enzyme)
MNSLNKFSNHPLQSKEWAQFREKTGVKVIREDGIQLTIHKIPKTKFTIGYFPKGNLPDKKIVARLKKIGEKEKAIFIQIEPNVEKMNKAPYIEAAMEKLGLVPSAHPLFTRFTFLLDLTKSEEELLKEMHPKTRYNIRVAQRHGVKISEDNSEKAFSEYLKLTWETTKRQNFYAHTEKYHLLMWETLRLRSGQASNKQKVDKDRLSAHLLTAKYNNRVLAAWIVFVYNDTLYYPYGASSIEHKETMASNLMMWEVIKFGKKLGLKKFDMWGSLGPEANPNDPWFGFHRFKQSYGPNLIEFIGSYDLVINPFMYRVYKVVNKIRWVLLKLKK